MAIYHFSAQMIKRSTGRSSVGAAAYRSGENIHDERTGLTHDYTRKQGVEYKVILAPENAPEWATDRKKLWNEVENTEKRKDAQTAREINVALPKELDREKQIELIKGYVQDQFVDKGMIADIAIHDIKEGNPHAHVMLTTRSVDQEGFGKKNRDWNRKEELEKWRGKWADHSNRSLEKANVKERIDHRSLKDQGIDRIPEIHVGAKANAMEKKGLQSERADLNREIKEFNERKVVELSKYKELRKELQAQKEKEDRMYKYMNPNEKANVKTIEKILGTRPTINGLDKERKNIKVTIEELHRKSIESSQTIHSEENGLRNIKNHLETKEELEKELEEKSDGFGKITNRKEIKMLKEGLNREDNKLNQFGVKDQKDYLEKAKEVSGLKKSHQDLKRELNKMEEKLKSIDKADKALKNHLTRGYINHYEKEFPQAKHWSYTDIKNIDKVNQVAGRFVPLKQIKQTYTTMNKQVKELNGQLNTIHENGERLRIGEYRINDYEEARAKVEELDKSINKVKRTFSKELQGQYTHAVRNMKRKEEHMQMGSGIKDRAGFNNQMNKHQETLQDVKPKIENRITDLTSKTNLLEGVVKAIVKAVNEERSIEMQKEISKRSSRQKAYDRSDSFGDRGR